MVIRFQADVPDGARVVRGAGGRRALRRAAGRGAGGRQALPVRVPPLLVARGRQGGPARPRAPLPAPRLALLRRPAAQAGRLLREGQAHQQRDGQKRTGQFIILVKPNSFCHLGLLNN